MLSCPAFQLAGGTVPELPEVEVLTRAVRKVSDGRSMTAVTFYRDTLREPIPIAAFRRLIIDRPIKSVSRRSKFMLIETDRGVGIFHLGMSGNILCMSTSEPKEKHTHAVFTLTNDDTPIFLHFVDPRRFGWITCCKPNEIAEHRLLKHLGPEPLDNPQLGAHLFAASRKRTVAVKTFLMDAHNVVGVGNIYASESLFRAGIHPLLAAGRLNPTQCATLATTVQATLLAAIAAGGTTFRDFRNMDGAPGYFEVALKVYGRKGEPCPNCATPIKMLRQGGRATYLCPTCQKRKKPPLSL